MNPRVLIFGAGGMLATALVQELASHPCEVVAISEQECDIRDTRACRGAVSTVGPNIVVNCAAYTDVNGAESRAELALQVNAAGARNVALAATESHARCVYISTDYVFDGTKPTPYVEEDPIGALNAYGQSKAMGEKECMAAAPDHAVIRSSWLYGPFGRNFVSTILRLASEHNALRVVADQVGTPTYTRDFARAIAEIAFSSHSGIFHVTNSGHCSWYEFACAIVREAGLQIEITPIPSAEYKTPAKRPLNSRLESTRKGVFTPLPPWPDALARYLTEAGVR